VSSQCYDGAVLDRAIILPALSRLAELLRDAGVEGELCLLGGTAMMLAFHARASTKDVDAIFEPAGLVRKLSGVVASERGLPEDWLNDAAKGFASARHEVTEGDLPQFDGLRLVAPTAEYLLAMKCIAARVAVGVGGPDDVGDIRFLLQHLGVRTTQEALEIVARYYPTNRVPARTQFLLEELLADDSKQEPQP
jgi:hypothetical protein